MRYPLALLSILAIKLVLLLSFGPISVPDTEAYTAYSDEILAGSVWLSDAGLDGSPLPASAIHMLGYPALISIARGCFGEGWRWGIIALQMALSLGAMASLCLLRRPLGMSHRAMLFSLVAVATTSSLVLDATLLTDSLNASLLDLAITMLLLIALSGRPMSASVAFGVGLLIAGAFLLRDGMSYLWLAMLPLLACAAAYPDPEVNIGHAALRRAFALVVSLLPLFAAYTTYHEWNRQRTGTGFVTTIGQLTLLAPVVTAASRDSRVFSGDAPLDQAAQLSLGRYDYSDVLEINQRLFVTWHQTAPEIAQAAYRKYFASWWQHPTAMARAILTNLRENQLFLLFRPIDALREYRLWATGAANEFGRWKSVEGNPWFLPIYLVDRTCKAIAAIIFASFFLADTLARMARGPRVDRGAGGHGHLAALSWLVRYLCDGGY